MKIKAINKTEQDLDLGFVKPLGLQIVKVVGKKVQDLIVTVIFVSNSEIRLLNKKFRNQDGSTDVLSFQNDDVKGAKPRNIGDVFVCSDSVKKNSKMFKVPFEEELSRVTVHGVLHLLGYDHEKDYTEGSDEEMFRLQEEIVKGFCLDGISSRSRISLLVGLGNNAEEYELTRHNVGFMFLDYVVARENYDKEWRSNKRVGGRLLEWGDSRRELRLLKPVLLMNRSGEVVRNAVKWFVIEDLNRLMVVHDDLDLRLGEYKIQYGRGPKDHKGVSDIERHLGTKAFWRLRIGIDNRVDAGINGEIYVLQKFSREEFEVLKHTFEKILEDRSFSRLVVL